MGNKLEDFPTPTAYFEFRRRRNIAQRNYRLARPLPKKRDPNKIVPNRQTDKIKYQRNRQRALELVRATKLRVRYGMTVAEYEAKNNTQNGLCAICGKPPVRYRLAVDHCHKTNKNRDLLCAACNTALGALENTEWREKAEAYLDKHRA